MKLFDCNASFGKPMIKPLRYAETARDLLKEMDFYGIDEAVVFHSRQREDSPVVGNKILFEEIIEVMKAKNIHAFRAFPSEHKYLMTKTALGSLYELMVKKAGSEKILFGTDLP